MSPGNQLHRKMTTMETPLIFMATTFAAVGNPTDDSETVLFEPGMMALYALCSVLTDQPMNQESTTRWLTLVSSPPDVETDEGFHVYQLNSIVQSRLTELSNEDIHKVNAKWLTAFERFHESAEFSDLSAALEQLVNMAGRGSRCGKLLFVKILYR